MRSIMVGKQVLVISYVGELPEPDAAAAAVVALQAAGTYIDTTVQPTMCVLDEKEQAQAMMVHSSKKSSEGKNIQVRIEGADKIGGFDRAKVDQLLAVLKDVFNG